MAAVTAPARLRLDALLVRRGLAADAQRAQALIAAGLVEVDGARAGSAAQPVLESAALRLTDRGHPWAGRGGLKLDRALEAFGVDCRGRVCLDAGASTGGFTDVLLARGASLVYAVDVGHGQLITRLAQDPRVRVLDRTNLRLLVRLEGPQPSLVTLDLSFISLRAVLPRVRRLAPGAEVVALFKPQFELPPAAISRGGVATDPGSASAAVDDFEQWSCRQLGAEWLSRPVAASVRGAKGNQEWLVHVRLPEGDHESP